jgi:hypothetical protein
VNATEHRVTQIQFSEKRSYGLCDQRKGLGNVSANCYRYDASPEKVVVRRKGENDGWSDFPVPGGGCPRGPCGEWTDEIEVGAQFQGPDRSNM